MADSSNEQLNKVGQPKKNKKAKCTNDDRYPLSQKTFFNDDNKKLKNDIRRKGPPHPYYSITYRDAVIDAPPDFKIRQNYNNNGKLFDFRGRPFWHPKFDLKLLEKKVINKMISAEKAQHDIDASDSSTTDQDLVIKPEDQEDYVNGKLKFYEMPVHESLNVHPWGALSLIEEKSKYFTTDIIKSNSIKAALTISRMSNKTEKTKEDDFYGLTRPKITWGPMPTAIVVYTRLKPKEQISVKYTPKDFYKTSRGSPDDNTEGDD
ncbi:Hypothetical protein SRAE_1000081400 [Strongyloides ratti]|uniref:Uncharacterized protein n=1 Tax=Strongyloides ratti TaxID=34506 RepID=A0A090L4W9_STRRB|nr:Hypothetical protein SRAE_1000081400 [Strongyloides ratti]CEF62544.1 Hypothetical protein SRAE_1000081400 [Strongyloides ratti]